MTEMKQHKCDAELFPPRLLKRSRHEDDDPQWEKLRLLYMSVNDLKKAVGTIDFLDRAEQTPRWLPIVMEAGLDFIEKLAGFYGYVHALVDEDSDMSTARERENLYGIELLNLIALTVEHGGAIDRTKMTSVSTTPVVEHMIKTFHETILNLKSSETGVQKPGSTHVMQDEVFHSTDHNSKTAEKERN